MGLEQCVGDDTKIAHRIDNQRKSMGSERGTIWQRDTSVSFFIHLKSLTIPCTWLLFRIQMNNPLKRTNYKFSHSLSSFFNFIDEKHSTRCLEKLQVLIHSHAIQHIKSSGVQRKKNGVMMMMIKNTSIIASFFLLGKYLWLYFSFCYAHSSSSSFIMMVNYTPMLLSYNIYMLERPSSPLSLRVDDFIVNSSFDFATLDIHISTRESVEESPLDLITWFRFRMCCV